MRVILNGSNVNVKPEIDQNEDERKDVEREDELLSRSRLQVVQKRNKSFPYIDSPRKRVLLSVPS
jgi:hypothetical protein